MNKAMILEAERTSARIEVLNRLQRRIQNCLRESEKIQRKRGQVLYRATDRATDAEIKTASDMLDLAEHRTEVWRGALNEVKQVLAEVTG